MDDRVDVVLEKNPSSQIGRRKTRTNLVTLKVFRDGIGDFCDKQREMNLYDNVSYETRKLL